MVYYRKQPTLDIAPHADNILQQLSWNVDQVKGRL
jgi:hypothetical protein